jgi:glycosyltransferase involved in cell wall biosynthesis
MKIAYFSPLPPKRTGIATYSRFLVPALKAHLEVHLFEHDVVDPLADCPRFDYVSDPVSLANLDAYDARIYHIGNNPYYHSDIYRTLLHRPGIVVLHDSVLYYLIAGGGAGALLKELCVNYGTEGLNYWTEILKHSPGQDILRYPRPERFPLLSRTLRNAQGIIVHSETTKRLLLEAGYERPISVINMIAPDSDIAPDSLQSASVRQELGTAEDTLLIGTFGFIGRTKRISSILRAMKPLGERISFILLILGEGDDLRSEIRASGLADRIICPGFVTDLDFSRYLRAADIVINLRYPSMGEASLTLIQAMYYSRPCIVTADAWFAELPDHCVWKIAADKNEIDELRRAVLMLAENSILRTRLGQAAREYVCTKCLPRNVAHQYIHALNQFLGDSSGLNSLIGARATGSHPAASANTVDTDGEAVKLYFARRLASLLPE